MAKVLAWNESEFNSNLKKMTAYKAGIFFKKPQLIVSKPEMRYEEKKISFGLGALRDSLKNIKPLTKKHKLSEAKKKVESALMWMSIIGVEDIKLVVNDALWRKRSYDALGDIASIAKSIRRHEKKLSKKGKSNYSKKDLNLLFKRIEKIVDLIKSTKSYFADNMRSKIESAEAYTSDLAAPGKSRFVLPGAIKRGFLLKQSYIQMIVLRMRTAEMIKRERRLEKDIENIKNAFRKMNIKKSVGIMKKMHDDIQADWKQSEAIFDTSWNIVLSSEKIAKEILNTLVERRSKFDIPETLLKFYQKNLKNFSDAFLSGLHTMREIRNQLLSMANTAEKETASAQKQLKAALSPA